MSDRPIPARYEPRIKGPMDWGVFDTFAQKFCEFMSFAGKDEAIRASAQLNAVKQRATEI